MSTNDYYKDERGSLLALKLDVLGIKVRSNLVVLDVHSVELYLDDVPQAEALRNRIYDNRLQRGDLTSPECLGILGSFSKRITLS